MVALWLETWLPAAALGAVAYSGGRPLARRVAPSAVAPPLAVLVGFAVLSTASAAFGAVDAFGGLTVAAVAAAMLVVGVADAVQARQRPRIRRPSPYGVALGAALGLLSLLALYPAARFDDTLYHLPLADVLARDGGFVADTTIRYAFFPQANETLFAVARVAFGGDRVAQAVELSLLAACAWLIFSYVASVRGNASAGLAAAALLLGTPFIAFFGTAAYVDAWVLAFITAATVVVLLVAERRTRAPETAWVLIGLLLGAAAAGKYQGLVLALVVGAAALVVARTDGRRARRLALGAAAFAVVALPWYARTLALTGDPVYPLAGALFGRDTGPWSPAEIAYQVAAARHGPDGLRGEGALATVVAALGLGDARATVVGQAVNPMLFFGAAGLLFGRVRAQPVFRLAAGIAAAALAVRLLHPSTPRYVMHIAGVCALAGGLVADRLLGASSRRREVFLCALALAAFAPTLGFTVRTLVTTPPPVGATPTRAYLDARVDCHAAVNHLDARHGARWTAYGAGCEQARHYADGRLLGDWFGPASYFRVLGAPDMDAETVKALDRRYEGDWFGAGGAFPALGPRPRPGDVERQADRLRALGVGYLVVPDRVPADVRGLTATGSFTVEHADPRATVLRLR